jgi:hypothetical protein
MSRPSSTASLVVGLTLVVLAFVGLEVALFLFSALFAD